MVFQGILSADSEAGEKSASLNHASVDYPISFPYYPVVLTGEDLPSLQDVPIGGIILYGFHDAEFKPISFQVDRKDRKGKYQIPNDQKDKDLEKKHVFDKNDECVFMAIDVGKKVESVPEIPGMLSVTELEITDSKTGEQAWVYALVLEGTPPESSGKDYVSYIAETDTIETDYYRMGFSKEIPLFMNMLKVKSIETNEFSPDLIDTMKVKHMGKFLHRFDFVRTQADFTSRLVAVKDGPVRVIRRTASKVRLFWGLKTPSVLTDYINYPTAFFVDNLIEFPFKMSWFFSGLKTYMTTEGSEDPDVPLYKVYSKSLSDGVLIDGKMTEQEKAFNASGDQEFIIFSSYGKMMVTMDLEKDFPIKYQVFMMDDTSQPDPPEDIPGQFGNLGFYSTEWEQIEPSLHHMYFSVYFATAISVEECFTILDGAPSFAIK